MEVVITESAADDLGDGHDFYEETEFGLGDKFVTSIMSDLRSLPMYAGIHEVHFRKYHRKISARFPFAIFYRVEDEIIRVYAILDTRRDPSWISKRLN